MENFDVTFKFIVVGSAYVGKSNILTKFFYNKFVFNSEVTTHPDLYRKIVSIQSK